MQSGIVELSRKQIGKQQKSEEPTDVDLDGDAKYPTQTK
tara:strand:+ start:336 stop:452 length:117 start_codon:yes stop_codon:yes gene_type:complete